MRTEVTRIDMDLALGSYLTMPDHSIKHIEGLDTLAQDCFLWGCVLYWSVDPLDAGLLGYTYFNRGVIVLNPIIAISPWTIRLVLSHELGHNVLQTYSEQRVWKWMDQNCGAEIEVPEVIAWPS